MLVVKIDLENNNENYAAVMSLLSDSDYKVMSMSWEEKDTPEAPTPRSGQTGEALGKNLSAAIDQVRRP